MVATPQFTKKDISRIGAALPDTLDPRRRKLLGWLLDDWSQTDLRDHFSRDTPAVRRMRWKRLNQITKLAAELAAALDALDDNDRYLIAFTLAGTERDAFQQTNQLSQRVDEESAFLARVSLAASAAIQKP